MGKLMTLLWVLLAVVVVIMGYIRLAPSDPVRWHDMPEVTRDKDFKTGTIRLFETGPDGLERFEAIALQTDRTIRLFGSVQDGVVTYVTRSAIMGFPDYTTVEQDGEFLKIYGRSRFGRSDAGVNRARVEGWIDTLQP